MKFDVLRQSDYEQGRIGEDAMCPIAGAIFNGEERRWELEVSSLEELMKLLDKNDCGVHILPPCCKDQNELPVLSILDNEADEEEDLFSNLPN